MIKTFEEITREFQTEYAAGTETAQEPETFSGKASGNTPDNAAPAPKNSFRQILSHLMPRK
ncbi:MAG: hypothetical protein LBT26_03705 [Clostridiales Family XIII bacterium]|nr:hypothetical protein [Clostridiales Family XIII bacterium]